jgi:hypothetical protein
MNRVDHWRAFLSFVDHPESVDVEAMIKQVKWIDPNSIKKGEKITGAERALTEEERELIMTAVDTVPEKPRLKRSSK